jgi:hypothetical protein
MPSRDDHSTPIGTSVDRSRGAEDPTDHAVLIPGRQGQLGAVEPSTDAHERTVRVVADDQGDDDTAELEASPAGAAEPTRQRDGGRDADAAGGQRDRAGRIVDGDAARSHHQRHLQRRPGAGDQAQRRAPAERHRLGERGQPRREHQAGPARVRRQRGDGEAEADHGVAERDVEQRDADVAAGDGDRVVAGQGRGGPLESCRETESQEGLEQDLVDPLAVEVRGAGSVDRRGER